VLQRVRRRGREPADDNFDDYSSGDEEAGALNALARDAAAALECVVRRMRESGVGAPALNFAEFVAAKGGPRPSWRPVAARVPCAAFPARRAQFQVALDGHPDDHRVVNVSASAFSFFVAMLYVSSFRRPDADVYTVGKARDELERNFELAKQCLAHGVL
jgi:hypothetical protein